MMRFLVLLLAAALSACVGPGVYRFAPPGERTFPAQPGWAFEKSDIPLDPAWRFGRLDNGMRFALRRNATPAGTAEVRLELAVGSLDEAESERGFAHYVEHMAFNGSTHVPEGEMVRLLQRDGLAFGADTNAETSFDHTLYKLNLPRADPKLLDTALMLMRETASELTFTPGAVARERGVVLSEMRDSRGVSLDNLKARLAFLYPRATYPKRLPIGVPETLEAATSETLRAFWAREYVPAKTTLIVVGDFDPDAVEAALRAKFADWKPAPPAPRPDEGRVEPQRKALAEVWLNPALSERVSASRHGPWLNEPDSVAQRRIGLLRAIGYAIVNRRLERLSRVANPPFRSAGFGTSDVFRIGRTTNLVVDVPDGGWKRGLATAQAELRRSLERGFTSADLAEQLANIRQELQTAAASADTRPHGSLVANVLSLLRDDLIPATPADALARFNAFAPEITPAMVLAALKTEAVPLKAPLLRFQGRRAPAGGAAAIRAAWDAGQRAALPADKAETASGKFAYDNFGPPGTVVADTTEPRFGIRQIRFANGVRLNLKRTALEKDRLLVRLNIDGGQMLDTKERPLATEMMSTFAAGGTGKHSQDALQSLLAGHTVSGGLGRAVDVFTQAALTTPADLPLQMKLLAAYVSDPGYRPEGETLYRQNAANFFLRYRSTPRGALDFEQGAILSDNDPRFTYQPPEAYRALTFAQLKATIAERLAHGAIEIGIVGDFDEAAAIAAVAATFGALPPREPDFRAWTAERQRSFTARRGLAVIRHAGDATQAIVRFVWPTRDDSDADETLRLELLQDVTRVTVVDSLREALGKSYSPGASSSPSSVWTGYGTFAIQASVNVADVASTRAAIRTAVAALAERPLDPDTLNRARAPMLERIDNALKSNGFWLGLTDRAQTRPQELERFATLRARLEKLTPGDVQETARKWLKAGGAVEIVVLPDGVAAPER